MKKTFYIIGLGLALSACVAIPIEPLRAQSKVIIIDGTKNAGKVNWENRTVAVGEIPQNEPITVDFKVTNISQEKLFFKNVESGCGCTIVDYPKEAINPNETSIIKATYDAKKVGVFYKIITVTTNFDEKESVTLSIQGKVVEKK